MNQARERTRSMEILAFSEATLPLDEGGAIGLDVRLRPDELVLLLIEQTAALDAIVDAVCGLLSPDEGDVRVLGHSWTELDPEQVNALRGRIGFLGAHPIFPPHLTIAESLVLGELYHTRRRQPDLMEDAARMCATFGMPGLPLMTPDRLSGEELISANCVRAFLGDPILVVVEEQEGAVPAAVLPPLANAIRGVRSRGGAVLWVTDQPWRARDARLPVTQRLEQRGTDVRPAVTARPKEAP